MTRKKKPGRGGWRPNSGRKPLPLSQLKTKYASQIRKTKRPRPAS